MGRPTNKKNFGAGNDKMSIRFYNGTSLVDGYVIKQTATNAFLVSDGTNQQEVQITSSEPLARRLAGLDPIGTISELTGWATISGTDSGSPVFVRKLTAHKVQLLSGVQKLWGLGTAAVNGLGLPNRSQSTPTLTPTTPVPTPVPTLLLSSAITQAEGNSGTATFAWTLTLNRDGSTAIYPYSWTVSGVTANAVDFGGTFPSGSGTFAAGETSKTITVLVAGDTAVEAAETFTLIVTAAGLNTVTSTGTISNDDVVAPPVNTAIPTVSGTAQEGQTLTANAGTWSNSPTSYTYQWKRDGVAISGSINSTRILTTADIGAAMTVTVTATNEGGSASATSTGTSAVIAATVAVPTNTLAPVVSGSTAIGSTLSTTNGTWSDSPSSYAYQWRRNGANIDGATGATYALASADAGASITCRVSATNAGGSGVAVSNSITVDAPSAILDTLIPWTPAMISAHAYDFTDATTMQNASGVAPANGDAVVLVTDIGIGGWNAAPTTTARGPILDSSVGLSAGKPALRFRGAHDLRIANSSGVNYTLISVQRIVAGGATSQMIWTHTSGSSKQIVGYNTGFLQAYFSAYEAFALVTPAIRGILANRFASSGTSGRGRLSGSETYTSYAATDSPGNFQYGSTSTGGAGSYSDLAVALIVPANLSRANEQRAEGWAHWIAGTAQLSFPQGLADGHPYKAAPPMVPAGTTSTATWTDVNPSPAAASQTWRGPMVELQADSFSGGNNVSAIPPTDSTTDVWGVPFSLTTSEQTRLRDEYFPGNGYGFQYLRFPLGFAYRGFRNIVVDASTPAGGLAKNIGPRFAGQDTSIKNLMALAAANGGGLYPTYWSPAPYWKTNGAYPGGQVSGGNVGSLWAGGTYARTVTLDSIRTTDPTQYAAQCAAFAAAVRDDQEYLHINVAPVRGFSLQNEAANPAVGYYGHCFYESAQLYADVFDAVKAQLDQSTILATYAGQANPLFYFGPDYGSDYGTRPYFGAYSRHHITNLSADADYAKSNTATWKTAAGVLPVIDTEFEYFADPGNDPWQFANTALVQAHFMSLLNAPTHCPMIHIGKQLGATGASGNTKGYGVTAVRLPAPFSEPPTTTGDPFPTLGHGEYVSQSLNANAVRLFSSTIRVGSTIQPTGYSGAAGTQVMAARLPNGKLATIVINRNTAALALPLGLAGTRTVKVFRYDKDTLGAEVDWRTTSKLDLTVPANSAYAVIEQ
jgi:hypothetical protein